MAQGSGVGAQVAYAKEGTKNTRATPDHWVYFTQESLGRSQPRIPVAGIGGNRLIRRVGKQGNITAGGSITIPLVPEGIGELLELCIGDVATTGTDPYEHEFTPGPLHSGTIQKGVPGSNGTVIPMDFIGSMVNQWTLSFDATGDGNNVDLQVEVYSHDAITGETLATPSYPAVTQLTSVDASLTVDDGGGADPVCVRNFSLTCANNLRRTWEACAAHPGKAVISEAGARDYTGTLTADFDDLTLYSLFVAGTECTLELTISDSSDAQLVITMNIVFTGETPQVDSEDVVDQVLPFTITSDTGDADAFTAVLTNGDSAP